MNVLCKWFVLHKITCVHNYHVCDVWRNCVVVSQWLPRYWYSLTGKVGVLVITKNSSIIFYLIATTIVILIIFFIMPAYYTIESQELLYVLKYFQISYSCAFSKFYALSEIWTSRSLYDRLVHWFVCYPSR